MFPVDQLSQLIKSGQFSAAAQLLRNSRSGRVADANLYDTFQAELSFETGDDVAALSMAQECLERRPTGEVACRLHRLVCQCLFNQGDTEAALQHLDKARSFCGARDRHSAAVELTAFEIALRFQPLDRVLGQVHQLRNIVVATGDPHLLALLRLYVARCEARRNGLAEVRRHHELVSALLERYENAWLEGLLALDRSVVAILLGDVDGAMAFAELALDQSSKSGHSHTRAAAHINLSHILERRGEFNSARSHLGKASEIVGANCSISDEPSVTAGRIYC